MQEKAVLRVDRTRWILAGALLLVGLLLLAVSPADAAASPVAEVRLGQTTAVAAGDQVELGYPAHSLEGTTWASVRPLAEGLGATVSWNAADRAATVTLGDRTLRFQVGSRMASVNGSQQHLPLAIQILNGKMQVPLRTLGEGLGYQVQWVAGEKAVLFVPAEVAAAEATLHVRQLPDLGRILTDPQGMSLYVFTRDTAYLSNCYGQCEENWPPLTVESAGTAVSEVSGTLGITLRKDGSRQVTLNGLPLYYFVRDEKAGDTAGQGLNEVWYVVSPSGKLIRTLPEPAAPPTPVEPPTPADPPAAPAPADPEPRTVEVAIDNFAYSPATLTVNVGDTVTWTNNDSVPHTVTGDSFDSGILQTGDSFTYTFTEAGTFNYICTLHPSMTGSVVVE